MNIDAAMSQFRTAGRELFNCYFRPGTDDADAWEADERFELVEDALFCALVSQPCGLKEAPYGRAIQREIGVEIRHGDRMPWLLNREIDSGYWDHPQNVVDSNAKLLFKRLFDWDQIGVKDWQYVQVLVIDWPGKPELVGKTALIEYQHVRFVTRDIGEAPKWVDRPLPNSQGL